MLRTLTIITLLTLTFAAQGADWPKWRGIAEDGVAASEAPLRWSDTENVKWKVELPGKGNSSPVIWGGKIFLTTAIPIDQAPEPVTAATPPDGDRRRRPSVPLVEHKFVVMCLDKNTGKMLWERTATTATPHEGYHHMYGSFASNSPVTDGERLYAFFGSRGVYCYGLDGELLWNKDFNVKMKMRSAFGEGVAPSLHEDTLILNFDNEADSFIVALDTATGEEKWRNSRDEPSTWAQPLVFEHDGRWQVAVSGVNKVRGYDFETGEPLWECAGLGTNPIPNPVYFDGVLVAMSGHRDPNLIALRLGASGDLTGTDAVLWSNQRGNSYTPSPVLHDGNLYMVSDKGMVSSFDVKTGEAHYQQKRLPKPYSFKASPVAANGKLYLASENEDVIVLNLGEEFEVLATNTLTDQMFIATPAVSEGELFFRGASTLYCITGEN